MWRVAALAGVASLVLAGCGGGGDAGSGGEAGGSEAPSAAGADCTPPQAQATGTPSTAPLKIGSLLPETGSLAFLGPPEFAGVEVALKEINDAGGVLGNPVQHLRGDSGDDTTDIANQTVDRHLAAGSQVIVGAAASGVSKLVIDKVTGAGVVQFSPANTSDEFTCWQDRGLYFRTAPPDVLQAQALAQLITADGGQRVSIMARNDPYGAGLADNTEQNLVSAGIPQDQIQKIIYDPNAASFNPEIDQVAQFNPDSIAVIGFDESKRIITRMNEVQIGPAQKRLYGTDGNMGNALGEGLPPGLLNGMKGTTPLTELSGDFEQRLRAEDPALTDVNYAGESYDAVVVSALAAEAAKSTNGADIGTQINAVTKEGEKCTTFAACKAILDRGGDVDYDGVTGTLDFTDAGEPGSGSYGVLTFTPQNELSDDTTYIKVGAQG
ncbi:Branched-chain amino acid ABC transporter, amino acid-binding protein [Pseudonocardia sp. Ae168_Ps1]|nr:MULTISPECIES: ABC transporter substrate-binding protein [unclassified Pseudonocardia]OLL70914.1 Branched-chain amino acid ABC transporter, amino acid-binding protein [Pseudonocardia sp. Ae168_Ps1]OLL77533.1 Branched-chain amino acid ABC transporter, amino acid-binding protein [Pseudonocardia sp. Ae150A_Ps1]OLL88353.1 Branched-chain amino acid ABC transporter, amino acid-binding protein [Pseudonocardia sp. Ae263_Ps1]OLL91624.1 Branched-chain amino acid ABC transporter, amino acid-binding prot